MNFKKSQLIQQIDLLPRVEKDRWTFVMDVKKSKVEVFQLSQPVRIVIDIVPKKD